ncbi:MAG: ABC transporter ATP-binding protein [Lentisphaerae bacterium]|nr:ABC transporter ATP-binding protein [Lentisphaerota bacterium]
MSLVAQNITYAYHRNGAEVLKNISCEFVPGRFYGIFGGNGSGKSTLLKALSGMLDKSLDVKINKQRINDLDSRQRARLLAFAAQENELPLPFTVRDSIALGRYVWGDDGQEIIARLLHEWQAETLKDRLFNELSGGEQQRVKLLRVLAQDTPYILLDEPASSLDWTRQLELYEKLRDLAHEQQRCIIMVAHDLYAAPEFLDQMLIMHAGTLLYCGNPAAPEAADAVSQAFGRRLRMERSTGQLIINW